MDRIPKRCSDFVKKCLRFDLGFLLFAAPTDEAPPLYDNKNKGPEGLEKPSDLIITHLLSLAVTGP
jgi:hypothetical protein